MSEDAMMISLSDAMARIERLERRDEFHQSILRCILREIGGRLSVPFEFAESLGEFNEAGRRENSSATKVAEAA